MNKLESLGVLFCLTNETEISGHTEFLKKRGRNFEKILPEMSVYFTSLTEFTVFFFYPNGKCSLTPKSTKNSIKILNFIL